MQYNIFSWPKTNLYLNLNCIYFYLFISFSASDSAHFIAVGCFFHLSTCFSVPAPHCVTPLFQSWPSSVLLLSRHSTGSGDILEAGTQGDHSICPSVASEERPTHNRYTCCRWNQYLTLQWRVSMYIVTIEKNWKCNKKTSPGYCSAHHSFTWIQFKFIVLDLMTLISFHSKPLGNRTRSFWTTEPTLEQIYMH